MLTYFYLDMWLYLVASQKKKFEEFTKQYSYLTNNQDNTGTQR